jgi:hypothetical protein
MKLVIKELIPREICHFASPEMTITSVYNRVFVKRGGQESSFVLPSDGFKSIFGLLRISRRALRLDKCNVVPVQGGFVIVRQGRVYRYDEASRKIDQVLSLKNCRNVLHQSIAVIDGEQLFLGEYGNNPSRSEVPVYRSTDAGRNWKTIFDFPRGKTRHVHACCYDPIEDKVWVLTGDFANECHILCADRNFSNIEWIGDGSQTYRACNMFFERDKVHWVMDSQLEDNYHIVLDRKSRIIERRQLFPGPVWYMKRLEDGFYLAATAREDGPGVKDEKAHVLVSRDLIKWEDVFQREHDGLPQRLFKAGIVTFSDGRQASHDFYLFGEALKGLDGTIVLCAISWE